MNRDPDGVEGWKILGDEIILKVIYFSYLGTPLVFHPY
jgi:hypothetical protein